MVEGTFFFYGAFGDLMERGVFYSIVEKETNFEGWKKKKPFKKNSSQFFQ
jgi:hypothetical protein